MTAVSDGNVTDAPATEDLVARVREVQPLLAAKSAQGENDGGWPRKASPL